MNKTKIEWCDYTINPVKGLCPMACDYCYARRMYKRFKWNPKIRFDPTVFNNLPTKPARIFVGSTIELFMPQFEDSHWLPKIFDLIRPYKWLTFIFLTKQPNVAARWFIHHPPEDNWWIGASATNWLQFSDALGNLATINAKVKFLSFEPLLEIIQFDMLQQMLFPSVIDWVIIGAQTPYSPKTAPKMSWVREILVAASNAGSKPVFMKSNLQPVIDHDSLWSGWKLRQEFPK